MVLNDFIQGIPTKAGVYQFYVYSLDKYYIGESVNIRRRILEHLNGNGKQILFAIVKEHGLDSIGFQILAFEDDRQKRIDLEHHYKCYYGFDNLLNSISVKETGCAGKAVLAFTKEGKFYKRFGSVSEAASFVCRKVSTVSDACLGNAVFVAGYAWMFETEYTEQKLQQKLLARKIRDIKKKQHLFNLSKNNLELNQKVVTAKNDKEELIFRSITEASYFIGVSVSYLSSCCHKKQKPLKNYEWSIINE